MHIFPWWINGTCVNTSNLTSEPKSPAKISDCFGLLLQLQQEHTACQRAATRSWVMVTRDLKWLQRPGSFPEQMGGWRIKGRLEAAKKLVRVDHGSFSRMNFILRKHQSVFLTQGISDPLNYIGRTLANIPGQRPDPKAKEVTPFIKGYRLLDPVLLRSTWIFAPPGQSEGTWIVTNNGLIRARSNPTGRERLTCFWKALHLQLHHASSHIPLSLKSLTGGNRCHCLQTNIYVLKNEVFCYWVLISFSQYIGFCVKWVHSLGALGKNWTVGFYIISPFATSLFIQPLLQFYIFSFFLLLFK